MKSKTPKTDAVIIEPRPVVVNGDMSWQPELVYAGFARILETQVQELRETLERMAKSSHWSREDFMFEARAALERTKPE